MSKTWEAIFTTHHIQTVVGPRDVEFQHCGDDVQKIFVSATFTVWPWTMFTDNYQCIISLPLLSAVNLSLSINLIICVIPKNLYSTRRFKQIKKQQITITTTINGSFSGTTRVNGHQNSQKHQPNRPPSFSSNSSQTSLSGLPVYL